MIPLAPRPLLTTLLAGALALGAASAQAPSPLGDPSGSYGPVEIGSSVRGTIAAGSEETLVYHTWTIPVGAEVQALAIGLSGEGADADIAIRRGAEIRSYEDTDVTDFDLTANPVHTLDVSGFDAVYVDVVNLTDAPYDYVLHVVDSGEFFEGASFAETGESGQVGYVDLGGSVAGSLQPLEDAVAYHTYTVMVPSGTPSLTLSLDADADLDLAAKHGATILDYDESLVDVLDIGTANPTTLSIPSPQAGIWFVDVLTYFEPGSYDLSVY